MSVNLSIPFAVMLFLAFAILVSFAIAALGWVINRYTSKVVNWYSESRGLLTFAFRMRALQKELEWAKLHGVQTEGDLVRMYYKAPLEAAKTVAEAAIHDDGSCKLCGHRKGPVGGGATLADIQNATGHKHGCSVFSLDAALKHVDAFEYKLSEEYSQMELRDVKKRVQQAKQSAK